MSASLPAKNAALGSGPAAVAGAARDWLARLTGWQHFAAAGGLGLLSVLAMAPFFVWPVLFVTLPGLVWLIDARATVMPRGKGPPSLAPRTPASPFTASRWTALHQSPAIRAAATAWWFGFGYHFFGLFWIGEAFLVEAEKFAVLIPLAVTLMPAGLALFWAAAVASASIVWRPGFQRVLALAITLSLAEWLRGHVLTGFPWNTLGYALTYPLPLMQSASVLGIYGLTVLTVLVFAAPAVMLAEPPDVGDQMAPTRRWAALIASFATLGLLALSGSWRLATPDPAQPRATTVRIVQPSVPQREKWRPENQERIFRQHLDMSVRNVRGEEDGARDIKLIIWPEAAMPFLPLRSPAALAAIGEILPKTAYLASGALRLVEAEPGTSRNVYNSLMVFGDGGTLAANYDKIHLVPFGEYLPLQTTLEAIGLEQLARLRGGFSSGITPRPLLSLPGLPTLGPLICYEAIFPARLVQGTSRPAAFLNVTNDGWFGNSTGPRQHFHQTRVRAVEEGLPILRSANNGISGIIDAKGRVVARVDMNAVAVIDGIIPAALPPTLYARFGDAIFALVLTVALLALALIRRVRAA